MVESPKHEVEHLLKDELGLTVKHLTHLCEFREQYRRGRFDTVECFYAESPTAEFHIANVELWEAEWFPADTPPFPLGMSARVVLDALKHTKNVPVSKVTEIA